MIIAIILMCVTRKRNILYVQMALVFFDLAICDYVMLMEYFSMGQTLYSTHLSNRRFRENCTTFKSVPVLQGSYDSYKPAGNANIQQAQHSIVT